ncbi:MAG: diguanylate cyclase [Spirochaetaceae bacterium]
MTRINIRFKLFLVTAFILLFTGVLFLAASRFLFPSIILNDVKDRLENHYNYIAKDFKSDLDFTRFILQKEKGLGGFVTIFNSKYEIMASTSPALSHMDDLPEIHLRHITPMLKKGLDSFDYYRIFNNAHKMDINEAPPQRQKEESRPEAGSPPPGTDLIILLGAFSDDYYIMLEKPTDMIRQGAELAFQAILITLAISFLTGLLLTIIISYGLTNPIYKIKKKAEAIASLDFDYKINIKNNDEISDLGDTISDISVKLKDTMGKLQESNQKLTKDQAELLELNEQLKILSRTDALTKLANRLRIDSVIEDEIYKSEVRGSSFSIILVDIDYFKDVNDTFGHTVGDQVLTKIANLLKTNSRRIDVVGRWGGEEFLIVLPDTVLEGATILAENMRSKIESHNFDQVKQKTASFGVGEYKKGLKANAFIKLVDDALYRAKESGRNRVEAIIN